MKIKKNKTSRFIALLILLISNISFAKDETDDLTCERIRHYEGGFVRYNENDRFYSKVVSTDKELSIYRIQRFVKPESYLKGGVKETEELVNNNWKVPLGQTIDMVEGINTVVSHPKVRTNGTRESHDFTVEYRTHMGNTGSTFHQVYCDFYYLSVSWCGDGVNDSSFGESCDPKDMGKTNWGLNGCSNECFALNKQPK